MAISHCNTKTCGIFFSFENLEMKFEIYASITWLQITPGQHRLTHTIVQNRAPYFGSQNKLRKIYFNWESDSEN